MRKERILLAEDDRTARISLAGLLEAEGFEVIPAATGMETQSLLITEEPDVALLDIRMPGIDGLTILRTAHKSGLVTPMIVMTAHGDSDTAIEAMKWGAFDYVLKPLDFHQLLPQIERAIEHRRLSQQIKLPRASPEESTAPAMVGHSPAMQHVYKLVGQVAHSDATVLIRGESGTGKELVVNTIHFNSNRASGALVKVNCAAIPEGLLESELFGHEKGAFTNASFRRTGRFQEADGGTLFLDEIGELAPALQSKLLRAIQERVIERLGSNTTIAVDIRLIAATSRNIEQAVAQGEFREDLYYRLNVFTIELPPLRDRRQDIPSLVQHFLSRSGRNLAITSDALAILSDYHWPGNVRELENTIERALVLAREGIITKAEIELRSALERRCVRWTDQVPLNLGWQTNIAQLEKSLIERALRQTEGNKTKAAELLGIQRRLLYEKMREYGISQ